MLKIAKSIGDLIYYYRLVKNYSQQELADKLPSQAKRYEFVYQMDYNPFDDLEVKVQNQDENADFFIPGLLLRTVIRGPIFDAKDPKLTLAFLKTEIFRCALEYFSSQDDYRALQAYLVYQYEILMKYI